MDPFFHTGLSISDSLKTVRKSVLIYETIIVDIRYIQTMLGHSSINVTEIYTHVTMTKQKDILKAKHPLKSLNIINQL